MTSTTFTPPPAAPTGVPSPEAAVIARIPDRVPNPPKPQSEVGKRIDARHERVKNPMRDNRPVALIADDVANEAINTLDPSEAIKISQGQVPPVKGQIEEIARRLVQEEHMDPVTALQEAANKFADRLLLDGQFEGVEKEYHISPAEVSAQVKVIEQDLITEQANSLFPDLANQDFRILIEQQAMATLIVEKINQQEQFNRVMKDATITRHSDAKEFMIAHLKHYQVKASEIAKNLLRNPLQLLTPSGELIPTGNNETMKVLTEVRNLNSHAIKDIREKATNLSHAKKTLFGEKAYIRAYAILTEKDIYDHPEQFQTSYHTRMTTALDNVAKAKQTATEKKTEVKDALRYQTPQEQIAKLRGEYEITLKNLETEQIEAQALQEAKAIVDGTANKDRRYVYNELIRETKGLSEADRQIHISGELGSLTAAAESLVTGAQQEFNTVITPVQAGALKAYREGRITAEAYQTFMEFLEIMPNVIEADAQAPDLLENNDQISYINEWKKKILELYWMLFISMFMPITDEIQNLPQTG